MTDDELAEIEAALERAVISDGNAEARILVVVYVSDLIQEVRRLKMLNQATAERLWDDGFYAEVPGFRSRIATAALSDALHDRRLAMRKAAIDQVLKERHEP